VKKNNVKKIGLILSGGGARAAYQVGVLKAISELLPRGAANPFPLICGTSELIQPPWQFMAPALVRPSGDYCVSGVIFMYTRFFVPISLAL